MAVRIWEATEKEVCRLLGAEHVGGPGQPDCRLGALVVEVKDHERKIDAGIVKRALARPWAQDHAVLFVSRSGFSKPALQLIEDLADVFAYQLLDGKFVVLWPPGAAPQPRRARQPPHEPPRPGPSVAQRVIGGLVCGVVVVGAFVFGGFMIVNAAKPPDQSP